METESMYRRQRKSADEVEAFSPLHRAHKYRTGARAAIKVRARRRDRRAANAALRSGRI
jgi:hypothetical protein